MMEEILTYSFEPLLLLPSLPSCRWSFNGRSYHCITDMDSISPGPYAVGRCNYCRAPLLSLHHWAVAPRDARARMMYDLLAGRRWRAYSAIPNTIEQYAVLKNAAPHV